MPIQNIKRENNGSALILVVIVTVLLSVIGIIFVMTMRIREMTTANVADDRDLDTAVRAVTEKIGTVLQQDLFGTALNRQIIDGFGGNEASDSHTADSWLASLEPRLYDVQVAADPTDDWYRWDHITNLYSIGLPWDRILRNGQTVDASGTPWQWTMGQFGGIVEDYQTAFSIQQGYPADADGDGVADSIWSRIPNLSTSRGKPAFAAIRIIDNCAMLNLNTANCFYQDEYAVNNSSMFTKWWQYYNTINGTYYIYSDSNIIRQYYNNGGRYLSEINYLPFLRGRDVNGIWGASGDGWYNILAAKKLCTINGLGDPTAQLTTGQVHKISMNLENPTNIIYSGDSYNLFDIGDELEIRNRGLLTAKVESRFERSDVGNFTFDAGGNAYVALSIPRDNTIDSDNIPNFTKWKWRTDPRNFDEWSGAFNGMWNGQPLDNRYKYDRRHVCTFYSFDRNIRSGYYLMLEYVLQSQPEAIEAVFRPLRHQPIDLRAMTTLTEHDNIIMPDPNDPAYIINAHRNILHLLYTLREREYFALTKSSGPDPNALIKAAQKAAQQVANIIDYQDDGTANQTGPFGANASILDPIYGSQVNADPTYIDKAIIDAMLREVSGGVITPVWPDYGNIEFGLAAGDVIYGYERQPFISEVYTCVDDTGTVISFAIEFHNPYPTAIDVSNWDVVLEAQNAPAGTYLQSYTIPAGQTVGAGGHLVLRSNPAIPSAGTPEESGSFGTQVKAAHAIRLLRTNPTTGAADLGVDSLRRNQILMMTTDVSDGLDTHHVLKRDDRPGVFCDPNIVDHQSQTQTPGNPVPGGINLTLGSPNGLTLIAKSYPLPVANTSTPFDRLADFQRVAYIGNQGGGTHSKSVTDILAQSSDESEIRFDAQLDWELLNYVCTLSRKEKGIPGRININTAPLHVIAAAIPPQLVMTGEAPTDPNYVDALTLANDIVANRPYTSLTKLLNIQAIKKYVVMAGLDVGAANIDDDLEERDWIFNRLSNIFTVRSDTFTAYILVRLGTDGPQRRMIAVFDRSNCWTVTDKPQLVALHPVPDPR